MVHSLFNKEMQSTSSALSRQQRCEAAVISYEDAMLWCRLGICHVGKSESKSYEQPTLFRLQSCDKPLVLVETRITSASSHLSSPCIYFC